MEKQVKDGLKQGLETAYGNRYSIEDFPVNVNDYELTAPDGAILVKTKGIRINKYVDSEGNMNPLVAGQFGIFSIPAQVDILIRDMDSTDEIKEFTEELLNMVFAIDIENDAVGRFIFQDASEVFYDSDGGFMFRTINFIMPVTIFFNGESE